MRLLRGYDGRFPSESFANAGRNPQKLAAVRDAVGVGVDVLVADSQDQPAVDEIASQARVILNTAGPFAFTPMLWSMPAFGLEPITWTLLGKRPGSKP
jgi:hypothetical protein